MQKEHASNAGASPVLPMEIARRVFALKAFVLVQVTLVALAEKPVFPRSVSKTLDYGLLFILCIYTHLFNLTVRRIYTFGESDRYSIRFCVF